jgi:uncharacterized membrane protein
LLNPWIAAGILLEIVSLAAQLVLLSWADLSYVVPVMSIGYVLTALIAEVFLHEPLSILCWAAILLITAGVALVSRTTPSSNAAEDVLETVLAKYVLRENVDWHRWAGATLVAGGVALLIF